MRQLKFFFGVVGRGSLFDGRSMIIPCLRELDVGEEGQAG